MRRHEQLSLDRPWIEHSHAAELAKISQILTLHPAMSELVEQDLVRGLKSPETGARGMSGSQVLRVLLLKQMNGFSYAELEFHVADSVSYRTFCLFGALGSTPSRSTLAENLKKVRPETLEQIQRMILEYAARTGVERGRKVRIDSTVVEANIHAPTDSSLLCDGIRVLTRLLKRADGCFGFKIWTNHGRRSKRRMLEIQNTGSRRKRTRAYRDLLKVSRKVVGYGQRADKYLQDQQLEDSRAQELAHQITHYVALLQRVIEQTERRVIHGEKVPLILPRVGGHFQTEVKEVSRWDERDRRIRWSFGTRWWSWSGQVGVQSSWQKSLSRRRRRSGSGRIRRTGTRAVEVTV